jgi:hypothetical protein
MFGESTLDELCVRESQRRVAVLPATLSPGSQSLWGGPFQVQGPVVKTRGKGLRCNLERATVSFSLNLSCRCLSIKEPTHILTPPTRLSLFLKPNFIK